MPQPPPNPKYVPCECGSLDAYWHGPDDGPREYACLPCWSRNPEPAPEPDIVVRQGGAHGFDYTVTRAGVLLASGWLRCASRADAVAIIRGLVQSVALVLVLALASCVTEPGVATVEDLSVAAVNLRLEEMGEDELESMETSCNAYGGCCAVARLETEVIACCCKPDQTCHCTTYGTD